MGWASGDPRVEPVVAHRTDATFGARKTNLRGDLDESVAVDGTEFLIG